ncbi:DUF3298 domain-containing protein [Sphingobacterium sp. LRF_L2]|uniref:DUF3298 and DUF4163 domain-containing protein n=1 Tax=Sphingobacterium sp. LRF_L2 TaxID=3369421 RepID=UPI003F611475
MGKYFTKSLGIVNRTSCLLIGASFFLWSCASENRSDKSNVPLHSAGGNDTLLYRMEYYKDFSPYFSGTETEIDSTVFTAHYPVFPKEVDDFVKKAIFIDGESTVEQVSESFLGGFNEYAEEQIEGGNQAFMSWFRHQNCRVVLNEPGFLTLKNVISDYTGGAHGMEVELYFNFDTNEKKQLTLTDIVQDTSRLREIAESYFRKQEMLTDTASYGDSYFFEANTFSLADNFGLTKEGLLFHYNPYEIKSYAEGSTTLLIPYPELTRIMTDKGKQFLESISTKI